MIRSEVFPTVRLAMEWIKKNYPNVPEHLISVHLMHGVGTRVTIKEEENENT